MSIMQVAEVIHATPASDGAGVKLRRVMSGDSTLMDPFLMLDEIAAENGDGLGEGFPSHPHRGIETISYMLKGGFRHEDHLGNKREISSGGMQWMNAGRGIIHSEMPIPENGRIHGFQIWLNLPAKNKLCNPSYQEIPTEQLYEKTFQGGHCRLLSGHLNYEKQLLKGPIERKITDPLLADIALQNGQEINLNLNHKKVMVYLYQGQLSIGGEIISQGSLAIMGQGKELKIDAKKNSGLLILAGTPLNEPVVQYGPFVMNSFEQIKEAVKAYNDGTLTER